MAKGFIMTLQTCIKYTLILFTPFRPSWPGTCSIFLAGLELRILLSQPTDVGITDLNHHAGLKALLRWPVFCFSNIILEKKP
jgi:hypothetical protein